MAKWQRIHLQCRNHRRCRFDPWVRKVHWRRGQATHSSILAWRIPWTEEPGGLQSIGSQKSDMTEVTQQARMQLNHGLNISKLKKLLSISWIKPESKDSLWTTFSTLSLFSLLWLLVCFNALSLKLVIFYLISITALTTLVQTLIMSSVHWYNDWLLNSEKRFNPINPFSILCLHSTAILSSWNPSMTDHSAEG